MAQLKGAAFHLFSLLAVVRVSTVPCLALDPTKPASSYIRTSFAVEDGLPGNIIEDILQTRDGFLWIGATNSVTRFDGRHFLSTELTSETGTWPYALIEGPTGDLWVGTTVGLRRIPKTTLDRFGSPPPEIYHPGSGPSDHIHCVQFDSAGILWVGTGKGLYRFNHGVFSSVLPNVRIDRIDKASNGHLLIVTSRGFVEWDGTKIVEHPELPAKLGVPADKIYHVIEDHTGARWFCTAAGLARQADGSFRKFGSPEVYRAYEDPQGNVWVSGATGLFRATAATLELAYPDINVRCFFSDRDGSLWVGTNGQGLIRLKDRLVRMYTTADGLPGNTVMSVLAGSDGKLWVGNNCGGLSSFDGDRFRTYSEKDGLANSCVMSVNEDLNRDVWVGTYHGGLFRFRDGHFKQFSKAQGLPGDIVYSLFPARDGSLWFTQTRVLVHMRDGRFRSYTLADGLAGPQPLSEYEDRHGVHWIGDSRVSHLDAASDRIVSLLNVPVNEFHILGEDMFGELYASSTKKGLFRIEGDRLVAVAGAPDDIQIMLPYGRDLWLIGAGISRASVDSLRRWEKDQDLPRDYSVFDRADGFPSVGFSDMHPMAAFTPDGKLWVSTLQGLAMLDTQRLSRTSQKPSLYMERIAVGRTVQAPGHELVLPPGTYHVELSFDAIELRSPEKIHFQYKMDGVDADWLDANAASTAVYNRFPKGTHQFHVRACNRDGIWDREGFIYNITQQPFFYETNLFRFAVFATVLLLIAAAYQYRLRQMTARMNAQLDVRVEERTRMARELHDTLLQTIQVSKMVAEHAWAGYREDTADPRTGALEKLSGWLARALEETRASLQSLRSSTTDTNDLADALRDAGAECVLDHPIEFVLSVQGTPKDMHPIARDEVYRIGNEAIRNACHHSGGSRVEVHLEYSHNLVLRVRDNGTGMDPDFASSGKAGHFGLKGMRERASRIGAKFTLTSSPASRTEVELILPGWIAFPGYRRPWQAFLTKRPPHSS